MQAQQRERNAQRQRRERPDARATEQRQRPARQHAHAQSHQRELPRWGLQRAERARARFANRVARAVQPLLQLLQHVAQGRCVRARCTQVQHADVALLRRAFQSIDNLFGREQ
jgi:hypothetical protein